MTTTKPGGAVARPHRWGTAALLAAVVTLPALALTTAGGSAPAQAASPVSGQVTRGADTHRTNWYPDQPGLAPSIVGSSAFGQLFSQQLVGQIYAQPVVANGVLVVVTEANYVYGLNPETGAEIWHRQYGAPFDATTIGCGDLTPGVGITSTPVIDTASGTVYVVNKQYVSGSSGSTEYLMHALDLGTGADRPNFPVVLEGKADNRNVTFDPTYNSQRPGLLLLGGRVYAAFSAHCQVPTWSGWVMGVDATSGAITARWADHNASTSDPLSSGGGIWMSGGGLASDGPDQIVLAIGNAFRPNPGTYTRSNPPAELSNAVVRLTVGSGGSLSLTDFFRPSSELFLDQNDLDLGSGGVALLPEAQFGTLSHPRLAVAAGKEGYVYLLDRDDLGGQADTGGADRVLGRYGPNGGVWSQPSVWPGDGGYVYVPTAGPGNIPYGQGQTGHLTAYKYGLDGNGNPLLNLVATSSSAWGFGSSNVVVTSTGTTDGSALIWAIRSASAGNNNGVPNASLVAYHAVPTPAPNGDFTVVRSFGLGTATKFTPPGVGPNGRVYAGTFDGRILGFGAPLDTRLTTAAVAFPNTAVGSVSATQDVTFAATGTATVTGISTSAPFSGGTPRKNGAVTTYPVSLAGGDLLTVPVAFTPTAPGARTGTLAAHVSLSGSPVADVVADLAGTGVAAAAVLSASTTTLNLGAVTIGTTPSSNTVTLTNTGQQSLTFTKVTAPPSPFSSTGLPGVGTTLAGGASVSVTVSFNPKAPGAYAGNLTVVSSGGTRSVAINGTAAARGRLSITPASLSYGSVLAGGAKRLSFRLTNIGGSTLYFSVSKAPSRGDFHAITTLGEGTALAAGQSIVEAVRFTPTRSGAQSDVWSLTPTTGQGVLTARFTGFGIAALLPNARPTTLGRAIVGHRLVATPGRWSVAPRTMPGTTGFSYQWLRDGKAIARATGVAYSLGAADGGHRVSVAVTAHHLGLRPVRSDSVAVLVRLAPAPVARVLPSWTGPARVGSVIAARSGVWAPAGGTVHLQWLKDGVAVPGATRSQLALGQAWRGHRLSLRVTVVLAGRLPGSATSGQARVV